MQTPLPLDFNGDRNGHGFHNGFRLQRFEALNWGTFDQRPWVLNLEGEMALLTGANGSGKSTLVDGLLTLLVPNKKRNYNQASSMTGKKERDEKSYVQGAYGRTRSEESYGSKPKLLREKQTLSVLLAYFCDAGNSQKVTLAQVLWMEDGSVRKFFAIAAEELAIASHFAQFTHISDLKKRLKASGVEIFEEFIRYSQRFRKLFGLQSEKALDLLNQTVSIKEIGGLNDFVRNHMLEKSNVQTTIQELQESYENLTVSHDAIQKARKQLEALTPLTEEAEKYTQLQQEIAALQSSLAIAPAYFAQRKLELLTQELQTIEQQLTQVQQQQQEVERHLNDKRQQEQRLVVAISQDSIGQRLQELTRDIQQRQQEVAAKQHKAGDYNRLAQLLNLPSYSDSATFYAAREQGDTLKNEIDEVLQTLEAQLDAQKIQRNELQKEQTTLESELESLRKRKSQIPKDNLDVRDRLAEALNLSNADLPFVGELLQVRPEAREWEGAIERLLRSFGLCILVPESHYRAVNAYVHQTDLRGRLVYYRVTPLAPNPTQRALDPQQVPHKLDIKDDNPEFHQWLREQLVRQFSYVCCDTLDEFQHEHRAITHTGLTKHGGERHEKDDRSPIGNRRSYILGWNNTDKIKALEAELAILERQLNQVETEIRNLERQRHQHAQQKSSLQDFMNFTFTDIDWRPTELNRLQLLEDKQQLEATSDRLRQLEVQLEAVRQEVTHLDRQRVELIREINTLETRRQTAQSQQSQCKAIIQSSPQLIEAFANRMATTIRRHPMTLDAIDQTERKLRDSLQEKINQGKSKQESSKSAILMRMFNFRNEFQEVTAEMGTSLEALDEYLKLKDKIEQDDLPRHERRFKELMTEKVIIAISLFKSSLEKQEEEIQQSINELNESLRRINYTTSTYIEIRCESTRDREIRDFRNDLIVCLGNVSRQSFEDNEERFKNIQTRLVKRFKEEDRWSNKVTDVRNWLDFSVSERYQTDDMEKEHHTDSSGKSGGQKAKLAYTILASAIAYQFGLDQNNVKAKSFRFVVIDEAFSKSDDDNARYAMELFRNLDLQLLVVTPKDKINVIEGHIANLHFVANTPEGNYSSIASISIDEYRQNRQRVLNQSYDYALRD